jgi:putative flippase GtrA
MVTLQFAEPIVVKLFMGPTLIQIVRYSIVGILNNLCIYLIYIVVTATWLEPKIAVGIIYPVSVITGYFGHARYSFRYVVVTWSVTLRYVGAHLIGYATNIAMICLFSDYFGYPHQVVQATSILIVAGILYVLSRYFVFRPIRLKAEP